MSEFQFSMDVGSTSLAILALLWTIFSSDAWRRFKNVTWVDLRRQVNYGDWNNVVYGEDFFGKVRQPKLNIKVINELLATCWIHQEAAMVFMAKHYLIGTERRFWAILNKVKNIPSYQNKRFLENNDDEDYSPSWVDLMNEFHKSIDDSIDRQINILAFLYWLEHGTKSMEQQDKSNVITNRYNRAVYWIRPNDRERIKRTGQHRSIIRKEIGDRIEFLRKKLYEEALNFSNDNSLTMKDDPIKWLRQAIVERISLKSKIIIRGKKEHLIKRNLEGVVLLSMPYDICLGIIMQARIDNRDHLMRQCVPSYSRTKEGMFELREIKEELHCYYKKGSDNYATRGESWIRMNDLSEFVMACRRTPNFFWNIYASIDDEEVGNLKEDRHWASIMNEEEIGKWKDEMHWSEGKKIILPKTVQENIEDFLNKTIDEFREFVKGYNARQVFMKDDKSYDEWSYNENEPLCCKYGEWLMAKYKSKKDSDLNLSECVLGKYCMKGIWGFINRIKEECIEDEEIDFSLIDKETLKEIEYAIDFCNRYGHMDGISEQDQMKRQLISYIGYFLFNMEYFVSKIKNINIPVPCNDIALNWEWSSNVIIG